MFVIFVLVQTGCSFRNVTSMESGIPPGEQCVGGSISRLSDSLLAHIRPDTIAVIPMFPSPFAPTWPVQFPVLKQDSVMISFYDAKGNIIPDVVQDFLPPGIYRFDPGDIHLNDGVYFIRCRVGDKQFIRKALLLR